MQSTLSGCCHLLAELGTDPCDVAKVPKGRDRYELKYRKEDRFNYRFPLWRTYKYFNSKGGIWEPISEFEVKVIFAMVPNIRKYMADMK